jgi:SAM-dependent methyltransferase
LKTEEFKKMYNAEKSFWWFRAKNMLVSYLADKYFLTDGMYLDTGCGTGSNLEILSNKGFSLGIDSSKDAINWCAKRNIGHLIIAAAENLPFKEGCFDGAVALDALEHIDDDRGVLAEIHRSLKPGGCVIITVPAYGFLWGSHDKALGHVRRYSKSGINLICRESGFKVLRSTHFLGSLFPLMMLTRLLHKFSSEKTYTVSYDWPGWLNILLLSVVRLELLFIKHFDVPFGTTIAVVALKSK